MVTLGWKAGKKNLRTRAEERGPDAEDEGKVSAARYSLKLRAE